MSFSIPLKAGNINKGATIWISLVIFIIQFLAIGRCQCNSFQDVRLTASIRAHEQVEPAKRQAHIHHGLVILYVNIGYHNLIILSCQNRIKSTYKDKIFSYTMPFSFLCQSLRNPHGLHTATDETDKRIARPQN